MPRIGNAGSGTCRDTEFADRSGFSQARIDVRESNGLTRVISFTVRSREDGNASSFGSFTGSNLNEVFSFTEDQEVVGFFGTQTASYISELGFVVVSKSCVAEKA